MKLILLFLIPLFASASQKDFNVDDIVIGKGVDSDASVKVNLGTATDPELKYNASTNSWDMIDENGGTSNQGGIATDSTSTGANVQLSTPSTETLRLTNASLASVDMIVAPLNAQKLILINHSGGQIALNNATGATPANQILTGTGANIDLEDEGSVNLVYDLTETKWMVVGGSGGGLSNFQDIYDQSTSAPMVSIDAPNGAFSIEQSSGHVGELVTVDTFGAAEGLFSIDHVGQVYGKTFTAQSLRLSTTASTTFSRPWQDISTATKDARSPVEGDAVYDTTLKELQFYNGTDWVSTALQTLNPVTDWINGTCTSTWGSTTVTCKYRQIGDSAEIQYKLSLTGTPVGALDVNYPTGITVDSAKLESNVISISGELRDASVGVYPIVNAYHNSTNFFITSIGTGSGSNHNDVAVNATTPFSFVNTDSISITVRVPVTGWSSGLDAVVQNKLLNEETANELNVTVANNGSTATAGNQNVSGWEDSVTRDSLGVVTIDYTGLGLTAIPGYQVTSEDSGGTNNYSCRVSALSTTAATIICYDHLNARQDSNFEFELEKKEGDVNKSLIIAATKSKTVTKTTTATLQTNNEDVVVVDAGSGDFTITLPPASGNNGLIYRITKSTISNVVTIDANASETIGGELTTDLAVKDEYIQIACDGSNWYYIADGRAFLAMYSSNAGQTIANASNVVVNYEDVVRDPYSLVTTGAGWVYTVPVDGDYCANAMNGFAANATGARVMNLRRNGSTFASEERGGSSSSVNSMDVDMCRNFSQGDTINIDVFQNSGGNLSFSASNVQNVISIHRVK